jgi:S-DNA-T family DNA segregation ATPase FtsK/SpoIIIE
MNIEQTDITLIKDKTNKLPELVRVGHFKKDKKIPAMLPFAISNGILFKVNNENSKASNLQIEYIILDLLKTIDTDLINIYLFDIGIKSNFQFISRLKLPNFNVIVDKDKITETLEQLVNTARNISTNFLTGNINTLKEFNEAEAIKEPYNIIVIPNFPNNFNQSDIILVKSIIEEASSCGIYSLITYNNSYIPEVTRFNQNLINDISSIENEIITIDFKNDETNLKNLEVPILIKMFSKNFAFDEYEMLEIDKIINDINSNIVFKYNQGENFISIPVGRSGRNILKFEMGAKADAFHCLIAGQTGTGKSTFLNSIITQVSQQYSPNEIRLHLLDYKQGVEFKIYKQHPNVETLLLDNSNTEFALQILEKMVSEFDKREVLYSVINVSKIETYNKKSDNKLPYHLIIIDEAQQLFTQGFDYNKKLNFLLEKIATQGRSYGIHLILCTQTFAECKLTSNVNKQSRLRIAFRLSDGSDCRAILGRENDSPLYLKRFQIVYNSENGLVDKNIIANTDNFNEENIEKILLEQNEKYKNEINFNKNIINKINTSQNKQTTNNTISSKVIAISRELKTPNNFNDL